MTDTKYSNEQISTLADMGASLFSAVAADLERFAEYAHDDTPSAARRELYAIVHQNIGFNVFMRTAQSFYEEWAGIEPSAEETAAEAAE